MTRILTIEPDAPLARRIAASLAREALTVEHAATAREALHHVTGGDYALVTVTHDIADIDGPTLVAAMRATGVALPILALDPDGSIERCVRMLKAGADDYQPFPLDFDELGARVHALLRRRDRPPAASTPEAAAQLRAPGIMLDRIRRIACVDATLVMLRPTEFRLLEFLMLNPDRVVTRRMILEAVWQHHFDPGTNLIEVHVKQLRKKIHDPAGRRFIRTVRRAGYYFSGEAAPDPREDEAPRLHTEQAIQGVAAR
ncbi:response regulator transcription factor [Burkholderia plantarii]|uniref:response regulator transcription factor n=1 Tax=Burkholderia plantarii TaxID=41899 RepID=UPI0006D8BAAD|nr:response regulator transcription factor [Burkholderia plantarii]ALK30216.1 DNA-binding response regulator [Burkholderia plantarii]GLZ18323.1 DNA-binding response regulator [Burkholderia plantarii]